MIYILVLSVHPEPPEDELLAVNPDPYEEEIQDFFYGPFSSADEAHLWFNSRGTENDPNYFAHSVFPLIDPKAG